LQDFFILQAKNSDCENFNHLPEAIQTTQKRSNPDSECSGRLEVNMNFCSEIPWDRRFQLLRRFFRLMDKNISQN
jgi:hypothetical protein